MILPACSRCQLRMRPQCIRGPCAPHLSCSRLVSSGISISRDTFAAATAAYSKFLDFAPFRCAIALNLEEHFWGADSSQNTQPGRHIAIGMRQVLPSCYREFVLCSHQTACFAPVSAASDPMPMQRLAPSGRASVCAPRFMPCPLLRAFLQGPGPRR